MPTFASQVVDNDLIISDGDGTPSQDFKLGDRLSIQSIPKIDNQTEPEFVLIVQVQDSSGISVFIAWASGNGESARSISWQPEKADMNAVQAFIWTSIDSPAPLSFAVQKSIDVNECSGSARCFTGTVTRITYGDTLRVDDISIRLSLVDTPERGAARYSEATAFTAAACPVGSDAVVDEDDGQTGGSYGRIVAKVYCGGKMLNGELLDAGHAEVYREYCDDSEFAHEDWVASYCI